jgi:hypothetical protein
VARFEVLHAFVLLLLVIINRVFDGHDHGQHLGAVTTFPSSVSLPFRSHSGSGVDASDDAGAVDWSSWVVVDVVLSVDVKVAGRDVAVVKVVVVIVAAR